MTLATHVIIAGAVIAPIAANAPLPIVFMIGVATHYLSDAIPHYDYPLRSAKQERAEVLHIELTPTPKNITIDLLKIGLDATLGIAVTLYLSQSFTPQTALPYLVAATGAILPDALQSVYWFWRKSPMHEIKVCHDFFHAKHRLKKDLLGIGSQLLILLGSMLLLAH